MKWILSVFLIILLSCVTTSNEEDRKINDKVITKMVEHMTKIRNLLRKLEDEEDTSGSEDDGSSEDSGNESQDSGDESNESEPSGEESSGNEPSESGPSGSEPSGSGSSGSGSSGSGSSGSGSSGSGSSGSGSSGSGSSGSGSSGSGSSGSGSSGSSSNAPNGTDPSTTVPTALTTAPIPTKNPRAGIQLLGFNSFSVPRPTLITFVTFILYINRPVARIVTFRLNILYRGRLRHLEELDNASAECTLLDDPNQTDTNHKYNCEAPKKEGLDVEQIVIEPDFLADNQTVTAESGEANWSEEAALAALNLQDQTKTVNKMYDLENGQIIYRNSYFILKGDIDDYNGKVGDNLDLVVYDDSKDPSIPKNVSCTVETITDKSYEFKCTPTDDVNGVILNSPLYDRNNNAINLGMSGDGNDNLNFTLGGNNGTTVRNNPIYRKSSSGLSGGAIAGIVIACAVVLIIASIIAMMLRKPAVPVNNTSSVVGLRTVDNYTE